MKVKFRKFSALGHVPTKATPGSACYDVYLLIDIKIRPVGTEKIPLDIGFKFSKKYVCRANPRSSMFVLPTFLGGRVIDSDYRGNICIILTNVAVSDAEIKIGDRIAQTMFVRDLKKYLLKKLKSLMIELLEVLEDLALPLNDFFFQ